MRITHALYFYGGIQCFGNAFIIIIFQTRNRICGVAQFLIKNEFLGCIYNCIAASDVTGGPASAEPSCVVKMVCSQQKSIDNCLFSQCWLVTPSAVDTVVFHHEFSLCVMERLSFVCF